MESRRLSKEEQKFTRVAIICVDFLQLPLIDILDHEIKPADLFNKISTCLKLANGKGLQRGQQRICFLKPPNIPDYTKFDVTLLYKLLRNLCSSLTPQQDWGKEPKTIDILIVHDIERLRLFRNEIAHAVSSEFTDDKFEQFWKKVESVIQRIQNFTSNLGCKTNYMQRLKEIKKIEFGYDDLEKYKLCLESIFRSDQPEILIKGDKEKEVLCGDTACFELELKQADLSHWTVTWHKMSGSRIEQINTSTTRYSDSTDRKLVIHSVCKEDKGNYQAVLSEKVSNGKSAIQVVSNVISLHTPGEPPFSPELKVTNGREDIFVHYKCEVPERSPRMRMLQWTKNGLKLNLRNKKYTGGDLDDDCLTIKSPTTNDRGIYCCTVSNDVGSESQEVKLDVPNATIFKETIVYCGSSTKLGAEVSSCPSPDEVKWQRSSDGNSFNFIDIDEPEYFGSTNDIQSPLLCIPKAKSDVQLYYRLYLRNKLGENISNRIYLNITGSAPNITVSHDVCFQNNSVKLIGKVYLLSGKLPAIQDVFWTKDGEKVDIQGSGGKYCKVGVDDPSLIIYNVNYRDIGSYQLTATNAVGSTKSDVIVLSKPQIVLERTERKEDGSYWFTLTIRAIPEPTYIQWSMKEKNKKAFELLSINDDEYKGTTDAFPHPVLVIKSSKFEKYKFQIEVKNFTGNSAFIIQGEKHSKVPKSDNSIHADFGNFYIDGGASVRFSDISNEIAENFPKEKINQIKDIIQDSCKVEDTTSLEQAVTPRDILRILKNNKLFTPSDVICMQYLLKRTNCQDLYTQCIKYAEEQDALCFYEKPLENGFRGAEFHVRGNLLDYRKEQIEKIKETVASIVGCSSKEIHVNGYRTSSSFFVVLSMKEPFTRKLLSMEQDEKDNLFQLNIDYIIVDNDTIYLERSQDNSAIENSTIPNIIRAPIYKLTQFNFEEETEDSRRTIFAKEICFQCHEEEHIVKYVCISCKMRICTDCFSTHPSEDHNVIHIEEFLGNKFQCLTCNLNASFHCHPCNSDYCDDCRVDHQANGILDHEWIDILSHALIIKDMHVPICCRCVDENEARVPATAYCLSCSSESPLCDKCSKEHLLQLQNHILCYDMESLINEKRVNKVQEVSSPEDKALKCTTCAIDKKDNDATSFCMICQDPEPMCDRCAKRHVQKRRRRNQDHEICRDLHKFGTQELTKYIPCEPCEFENTENAATHFCLNCKEPEPMCHTCANQHIKQRAGRGHRLSDTISNMPGYEKKIIFKLAKSDSCQQCPEEKYLKTPGKPKALEIKPDSVVLFWTKSEEKVDYYQIRFKSKGGQEKWKFAVTDADQNQLTINGLMANTTYIFQVRGVFNDQEGRYGPANDAVKTNESLATYLLKFSVRITDMNPPKYQLFAQELKQSRNYVAKTRKLILGNPKQGSEEEKTIMLVGATGSGKSTLVDGFVNYVMGVSFDDPFRFTLVQLEEEEKKTHNQAISQTEWITVYKIAPQKGSRLNFTLNIIDTPGFGDTRGIERDQGIIDQIRYLFSSQGEKGELFIDAVCFIVKAPDARLMVSQKYIFSSIMSLFGKDIESNICTLITFADGAEPPVLASLKEANLPFGSTFQFNNSALFAENKNLTSTSLSPMFWEMGCNSFQNFFNQLSHFETKSLSQTKDVLKEREQLKTVISSILPQVKAGLSKLGELREQLEIFKKHKDDIENNKDFEYEVEETKQSLVDLPRGQHVTNCLQCNVTCHENCAIADDAEKRGCWAMTDGICRICIGNCIWSDHKNTPYIFRYSVEKVKKTYAEMKEKYEKAKGSKMTHETYIEELTYDVDYLFENVQMMMEEMNKCKRRLKEIALRPDPLNAVEHLDLMIQAEETERQPGYKRRIRMLHEFRRMALVDKQVENFDQSLKSTKDDVTSAVGKAFTGSGRAPSKRKTGILQRGLGYLQSFFV